ncbi:MAG: aspartyl protease family protein [Pseudomonadota bacterium]
MKTLYKYSILLLTLLWLQPSFAVSPIQSVLPIQLNTGNPSPYGVPSTDIYIQGKKIPVIFDTGTETAGVMLTKQALKTIKVNFTGKHICMSTATGDKQCYPEFIIPKLKLGDFILNNVKGLEQDNMKKFVKGHSIKYTAALKDGTIGYSIISQFNVLIDYRHRQITLYSKNSYPIEYTFSHWLHLPFDHLYSVTYINHKASIIFWDTGTSPSIIAKDAVGNITPEKCLSVFNHPDCQRFIPKMFTTMRGIPLPNTWFNIVNLPFKRYTDATIGTNFYLENEVFIDFGKNMIYIHPYSQETLSQKSTLPLTFNTGNTIPGSETNLPSTIITIENKPIPLILDSGESQVPLALSPAILQQIHYSKTDKKSCATSRVTGKICRPIVIIPNIKIGHFELHHVEAEVMQHLWGGTNSKQFKQTQASENGVIGLPLLSKFNVLLDYAHASVTFFPRDLKQRPIDSKDWVAIPFSGPLLTHLVLDGTAMIFGWDTGAVPGVIKQSSAAKFKKLPCPAQPGIHHNKTCQRIIPNTLQTTTGEPLTNTWFIIRKFPLVAPFDGLMGAQFFSRHLVYFDFDHHIIYVKPIGDK